jgi:hypothetical protein
MKTKKDKAKPKTSGKQKEKEESPETEFDSIDDKLIQLLKSTIDDVADENGWAFLAEVGALLNKKKPDFDPRNYGFSKLTPLIKALNKDFTIHEKEVENTQIKHIFVKNKR